MTPPKASVVVRTKNEERWIGACLRGIRRQSLRDVEIVLVDNESTDQTVSKARPFVDHLVTIEQFRPGRAINLGIEASSGSALVCISGHCIPTDERWLENLVRNLDEPEVAGVYGRQVPLSYSSPLDKRDLMITFGLDRKVQRRDSFFHNANSAFRRDVWEQFRFDDEVTNIEDRLWARQVLEAGYVVVYEPEAAVYHHHGIHHAGNPQRAAQIVRIMEEIDGTAPSTHGDEQRTIAIIPSRGAPLRAGGISLVELAVRDAMAASAIDEVVVATDDDETAEAVDALGARVLRRPEELSEDYVGLGEVLQFALGEIEDGGDHPDLVVILEATHPFRRPGLLDDLVREINNGGLDSVLAGRPETRRLWVRAEGVTEPVGASGLLPRQLRESETFLGLFGLGCVTRPELVRDGTLIGDRVGIHEVRDPLAAVEVRDEAALREVAPLLDSWRHHG